ncbi:putative phage protein (TIGR02216 family) [Amorphus suaedae]
MAFPWTEAMRFGLGRLGLAPAAFWAMSLPELMAALPPAGAAAGETRRLRALIIRDDQR